MASHVRNLYFWKSQASKFKPGSTVLITGAGSGIGQQIARIYAARPCSLVLADINSNGLIETEKLCKSVKSNVSILTIKVDVTDQTSVQSMIDQTLEQFKSLDIMILCAGLGAHHLFDATKDLSIFHKLMSVNFFGYLNCIHAAYQPLVKSHGSLVAITSFSGEVGLPYRTAYCASKFAVTGLLESLRSEMSVTQKQGFDITIVCPPSVDTNLRKNSLTNDPNLRESGQSTKESITAEQCAEAIVDAADRRLRKAFFPFNSWVASYLRPLVPDLMDKMIMKRAKL